MRYSLAALLTTLCLVATATVAQASIPVPPGGTPTPTPDPSAPGHYINPVSNPAWQPSRVDMGIDWIETKKLPVKAIGKAVILGAQNHASWPGKHFIFYELLTGNHAGDIVYVAEHITNLVKAGTVVNPGQRIATAIPGYPWTEWGWADAYGSPRALSCYKEGKATHSGKEMARFLTSLGARLATAAGTGADTPTGRLC
ncbi:MAG TPA: hypothetical protein VG405_09960 [Solirubrobacteraceae bacterium]|jgi:hypothetical protein|nr:hypothetical protein [Solirubrobacteraceae bacterium]